MITLELFAIKGKRLLGPPKILVYPPPMSTDRENDREDLVGKKCRPPRRQSRRTPLMLFGDRRNLFFIASIVLPIFLRQKRLPIRRQIQPSLSWTITVTFTAFQEKSESTMGHLFITQFWIFLWKVQYRNYVLYCRRSQIKRTCGKNCTYRKILTSCYVVYFSELILRSWIKKMFEAYELPNNLPSEVPRSKKMWTALLVLGGKTLFLLIVSYIKGNWSSQTMGRGAGSSLMGHRLDMKTWTWVFLATGSEPPSG